MDIPLKTTLKTIITCAPSVDCHRWARGPHGSKALYPIRPSPKELAGCRAALAVARHARLRCPCDVRVFTRGCSPEGVHQAMKASG